MYIPVNLIWTVGNATKNRIAITNVCKYEWRLLSNSQEYFCFKTTHQRNFLPHNLLATSDAHCTNGRAFSLEIYMNGCLIQCSYSPHLVCSIFMICSFLGSIFRLYLWKIYYIFVSQNVYIVATQLIASYIAKQLLFY